MLLLIDVRDRAAARARGHGVAKEVPLDDEHARRLRTADELVRRDEHRVLVDERVVAIVHLDLHVRTGRREVPERQRAVLVEQPRDRALIGRDARDVGGRREAADLERPRRVLDQLLLEVCEIDVAISVLVDHHDLGDRLTPGQLVGVMLEGPDEHDRALVVRDLLAELVARVEIGGQPQVHDVDQLVDRAGRAGATEDHQIVGAAADRAVDDLARVVAELGGLPAGAATSRCGCWRRAASPRGG